MFIARALTYFGRESSVSIFLCHTNYNYLLVVNELKEKEGKKSLAISLDKQLLSCHVSSVMSA